MGVRHVEKLDLKREIAAYRATRTIIATVDVPDGRFLMIDGRGSPRSGPGFASGVEGLVAVAHAVRLAQARRSPARDFAVMPVETLWWHDGPGSFATAPEAEWRWTVMIRVPDFVTERDATAARASVAAHGKPAAAAARLETFREGRVVQVLHVGPHDGERPTVERMHRVLADAGYVPAGKHHEIHLSDPRRAAPERLRTILRQPVRRQHGESGIRESARAGA